MKALIIGCGRLGAELAYRLYQGGHEVSIVDVEEAAFNKLPPDFQGRLSEGDAMNREVLRRAGIEQVDSLAVVTDNDVLNAVLGHLAMTNYNVPNVVVRNYTPRYRPIQEAYGLQIISALSWGAQRIEEMMYHADVRVVFSAGNGEVEVYEIAIPNGFVGHAVDEVVRGNVCLPVAITRAGKAILPNGKMTLEEGDVLHVSATLDGVEELRHRIAAAQKGA